MDCQCNSRENVTNGYGKRHIIKKCLTSIYNEIATAICHTVPHTLVASDADGPVRRNFWGTWMKQAKSWRGETRRTPLSLTLKKHSTR